jgi:DnaK suppressor protein
LVTAKAKSKSKTVSKVAKGTAKAPKGKATAKSTAGKVKKVSPKPLPKSASKVAAKLKVTRKAVPKTAAKTALKVASKAAPKVTAKIAATPTARTTAKLVKTSPPMHDTPSNLLAKPSTVKVAGGLSEAEVIKQAKTNYMSRAQLNFFKQRLLALQTELRDNAGATTEHLRELAVAPDPADRATLEEEHALELRTRDRERKLLKKVQSALMRIEDGSYGYCEETGEPIGVQRLLARPTATLTIEAQERRELKQKMYGE